MIILENVSKKYGEGPVVLDQLNLTFAESGLYVLCGESGCGKTTLLGILAGLLPYDGTICCGDTSYTRMLQYPKGTEPGYITQDPFFADFLTVRENLRLLGGSEEEISENLKRLKLEQKTDQLPATLSGGEKQRLAIARALLSGSRILLLDEPTASLDDQNKQTVFEILRDLKEDCLILCATHDPDMIPYADTVLSISKESGRIEVKEADPAKTEEGRQLEADPAKTEDERQSKPASTSVTSTSLSEKKRPNIHKILFRWLFSPKRERGAFAGFLFFLIIGFLIVAFSDLPMHKVAATEKQVLGLNSFPVHVDGKRTWNEIKPKDSDRIREVILDYSWSYPDGYDYTQRQIEEMEGLAPSEIELPITFDTYFPLLPNDSRCLSLSDRIAYGTYFTKEDQIILSHEMAEKLAGGQEEKLLGTKLSYDLYGLGEVELEVVGIFEPLNYLEMTYLQGFAYQAAPHKPYNAENYTRLFFANAALVSPLEEDPEFFQNFGRHYVLCFDSYQEMASYRKKCEALWKDDLGIRIDQSVAGYQGEFAILSSMLIPLGVFMGLLSALFFAELKRAEFAYNNRVVAVLEYSGYTKKQVVNGIVRLTILEILVYLGIAFGAAYLISLIVNHLNVTKWMITYCLFSWNPVLVIGFMLLITVVSGFYTFWKMRSVQTVSWYEQAISSRDVL